MKKMHIVFMAFWLFIGFSFDLFAQVTYKEIKNEDIWKGGKFYPATYSDVIPLKDGEHYLVSEDDGLIIYSYKTGSKSGTLVEAAKLIPDGQTKPIAIGDFDLNADESKVLFATETEYIYRHSSKSTYYVWDIKAGKLTALSAGGKQRLASFSPDGSKVGFIRDNNLFIKDLVSNKETQVTKDGLFNSIINGTTDWVYEEEFGFTRAFFWSPDGSKIAYYKFDESKVKEFTLINFGQLYPEEYKYKYPKAGEDNSLVNIYVYNLSTNVSKIMDVGAETNQYIPRIKWTNNPNILSIQRLNRLQNKLEILHCNATDGKNTLLYTEENKTYVEITDDLTYTADNSFLISSEKDGYNQIYYYDSKGKLISQVTKGKWDVTSFLGYDEKTKIVYYISSEESPLNRTVYSIKIDGKGKKKLSIKTGTNNAQFSKNYKYFINTVTDANTPHYVSINNGADGKEIKMLENNSKLLEFMKEYGFAKQEFFTFKTSENVELNGSVLKPLNFDPSKKYPVFMYVYGGPGSQTVQNRWGYYDFVWYQMLAQKGYIIVSVDNRGTGARGEEFKKCTYLQMGKYETIDQIEAAKYLGTLPYIDKDRIGIWGWSYGGFMSTLCITKGADYFKMAIAVAPVTNWRYYDNIYTERFMRTPQENPSGYDDNSPINHVDKLKGKYLLVHGLSDDNVHAQNSMDLISALVNKNKQFEMQLYPNKNHGIYGGYTRLHLYNRMTDFILRNL
jgi:dipeptidyl-peptidase-4